MFKYIDEEAERAITACLAALSAMGVVDKNVLKLAGMQFRIFYLQGIIYGAGIFDDEWSEDGPGIESEIEVPDVIRDIFGAYL